MNEKREIYSVSEVRLRKGALFPLFCRYAIPSIISLVFVGLQAIVDGIVLGNFIGADALACVSLTLPCYSFMAAMGVVIGIGCQTIISIRLGEQRRQEAHNALRSAFVFLVIAMTLISIFVYIFARDIALLLGANDILLAGAVEYLNVLVPFFPIIVVMFFCDYVIKSMGFPIFSMITMSSAVILNIILDLLFVGVWEMGIHGAGLATGLAFCLGACCNLILVFRRQDIVSIQKGKFRWRLVWEMIYNGSSEGVSELSSGISTWVFNIAIMYYIGASGVAAFTAINYAFFMGITVFLGVSDGVIPIISYNFGANQWGRIKEVLKMAIKSNFIIGLILFSILFFGGKQIISLFFKQEEVVVLELAAQGTQLYAFAFLINGFNIFSASYFTAMANAKISIIISLLRGFVFVVAWIYILPKIWGINGIWCAVPLAEIATLFVSFILVRKSLKNRSSMSAPLISE